MHQNKAQTKRQNTAQARGMFSVTTSCPTFFMSWPFHPSTGLF